VLLAAVFGWLVAACGDDSGDEGPSSTLVVDTLFVPADARIQSDAPDATFGIDNDLTVAHVTYAGGYAVDNRVLIRLPQLPDSIDPGILEITTLILQYNGPEESRSVPVSAFEVTQLWVEGSVTWNSQPEADSVAFASASVANKQLRINVRNLYQTAGRGEHGILLTTQDGMEQHFYSRETIAQGTSPIVQYTYRVALSADSRVSTHGPILGP
jgi:hypothetical protein